LEVYKKQRQYAGTQPSGNLQVTRALPVQNPTPLPSLKLTEKWGRIKCSRFPPTRLTERDSNGSAIQKAFAGFYFYAYAFFAPAGFYFYARLLKSVQNSQKAGTFNCS